MDEGKKSRQIPCFFLFLHFAYAKCQAGSLFYETIFQTNFSFNKKKRTKKNVDRKYPKRIQLNHNYRITKDLFPRSWSVQTDNVSQRFCVIQWEKQNVANKKRRKQNGRDKQQNKSRRKSYFFCTCPYCELTIANSYSLYLDFFAFFLIQ